MSYAIIPLQEETFIEIKQAVAMGPPTTYTQPYSRAVNIASFRYVAPWVRIKADPSNSIVGKPTIKFRFLTAAVPPNLTEPGVLNALSSSAFLLNDRFYPYGPSGEIEITDTYNSTTPGKTYLLDHGDDTQTLSALINPGGLMIYQIDNVSTTNDARFRFDIHLVCRGPA